MNESETNPRPRRTVNWRHMTRGLVCAVIALVLFGAGVLVGQGRLSLSRNGASLNSNLPNELDYSSVTQVYQALKNNYDGKLTTSQLLNGLKAGLAESTNDPYTEYFTAAEAKDFDNQLNNAFSGVGVELGENQQHQLLVVAPIDGSPGAKAGLQAQDIITAINGQSAAGISLDEAVSKVRGKAGTQVTLQVLRDQTKQLNFTITRQNLHIPSVMTKTLPGNIGYIRINTFGDDTADLMAKAAQQFQAAKVKGIVLDLRDNPGGLLSAAIATASHWLPDNQLILQEKRGNEVVGSYSSTGQHELLNVPTVVLIDQGSASAAEITAGALHDDHAAYLIGVKSFGKGVVQQIVNFKGGSELKVTVASWYRPNGQNINHKGITPDKTVQEPANATTTNDPQLSAAETYLQNR